MKMSTVKAIVAAAKMNGIPVTLNERTSGVCGSLKDIAVCIAHASYKHQDFSEFVEDLGTLQLDSLGHDLVVK